MARPTIDANSVADKGRRRSDWSRRDHSRDNVDAPVDESERGRTQTRSSALWRQERCARSRTGSGDLRGARWCGYSREMRWRHGLSRRWRWDGASEGERGAENGRTECCELHRGWEFGYGRRDEEEGQVEGEAWRPLNSRYQSLNPSRIPCLVTRRSHLSI